MGGGLGREQGECPCDVLPPLAALVSPGQRRTLAPYSMVNKTWKAATPAGNTGWDSKWGGGGGGGKRERRVPPLAALNTPGERRTPAPFSMVNKTRKVATPAGNTGWGQ